MTVFAKNKAFNEKLREGKTKRVNFSLDTAAYESSQPKREDQMVRGQNKAFAKQSAQQIAQKHLPNKKYVHEQVTYDSVRGALVGDKSDRIYSGKEAVLQNANFDELKYLEALGNGEQWAFDRNDKLIQLANERANEKTNKQLKGLRDWGRNKLAQPETRKERQKSDYHNLIKKSEAQDKLDSLKEAEAREKLYAAHKGTETLFKGSLPPSSLNYRPEQVETVEQYMARREREHKEKEFNDALKTGVGTLYGPPKRYI